MFYRAYAFYIKINKSEGKLMRITGGKLNTMEGRVFERGYIDFENGKITAFGDAAAAPAYAGEVLDVAGGYIMPGMIDAHTHIGIGEEGVRWEGADYNETSDPVTPNMRALDGFYQFDTAVAKAAAGGVTSCAVSPGSANVIGGEFVAIKTFGDSTEDMTLRFPVAMKAAFGENPKRVYSSLKQTPQTRMATAAVLRKALIGAQEYQKKLDEGAKDPSKMPERDIGKERLAAVLRREMPMKIHAHRADDILTAIRICREFNIRFTLDHCTEGYLIPTHLKKAIDEMGAGIIIGPLLTDRSKIELKNLSYKAPISLYNAGIPFAMMTDSPVIPEMYLPVCAALAVREGLPEEEALRSITINAAKITGIDDRVGSLEVGKDADIAVFNGDPLEFRTRCKLTIVNGKIAHEE